MGSSWEVCHEHVRRCVQVFSSRVYHGGLIQVRSGVEPRYMGISPAIAIPKVLAKTGLSKEDIDVWEVSRFEDYILSGY